MTPPGFTQASPEGVFICAIADLVGDCQDFLVPESCWNNLMKELGIQSEEESEQSGVADLTTAYPANMRNHP